MSLSSAPSLKNLNRNEIVMAEELKIKDPSEQLNTALKGTKLIVINFYADWCSTCRAVAPVFASVRKDYKNKAAFISVNVDDYYDLSNKFNIRLLPTVYAIDPKTKDKKQIPLSVVADKSRFKKNIDELINYYACE